MKIFCFLKISLNEVSLFKTRTSICQWGMKTCFPIELSRFFSAHWQIFVHVIIINSVSQKARLLIFCHFASAVNVSWFKNLNGKQDGSEWIRSHWKSYYFVNNLWKSIRSCIFKRANTTLCSLDENICDPGPQNQSWFIHHISINNIFIDLWFVMMGQYLKICNLRMQKKSKYWENHL